jgi:tetratricopeptide (TPR) repeat protein
VDRLSEDLRRHFAGLPVSARGETALYVAGRFLRRHWLGAAASALVAISLAGGAIVASWEARQAQKQRQVAQERLRDIVDLAGVAFFDIHNALERLPGATGARQQMVEATLNYLDKVAKTSGDDPGISDVLAGAYERLGDVQGMPDHPSLGDTAGAQASYQKALAVLKRNQALHPQDPRVLAGLTEVHSRLGRVAGLMGRSQDALAHYLASLAAAETSIAREPAALPARSAVCSVDREVADLLYGVKPDEAREYARKGLAVCQTVAAEHPGDPELLTQLADAHSTLGKTSLVSAPLTALDQFKQAAAIRERLVALKPDDALLRRVLMVAYGHIGDVLGNPWGDNLGQPAEAIAYYHKAVAIAESLAQADPRNGLAQYDLASALMREGLIAPSAAGIPDSLKTLRRAAAIEETLRGQDAKNYRHAENLAVLYEYIGTRLADLGDRQAALASYRQSLALAESVSAEAPRDISARYQMLVDYHWLSRLHAEAGDRAGAVQMAQTAIAAVARFEKEIPGAPSLAYYAARGRQWLGEVYRKLAETAGGSAGQRAQDWRNARAAFAGSVEAWQKTAAAKDPGTLSQELRDSQAGLAECDRQLALLAGTPSR